LTAGVKFSLPIPCSLLASNRVVLIESSSVCLKPWQVLIFPAFGGVGAMPGGPHEFSDLLYWTFAGFGRPTPPSSGRSGHARRRETRTCFPVSPSGSWWPDPSRADPAGPGLARAVTGVSHALATQAVRSVSRDSDAITVLATLFRLPRRRFVQQFQSRMDKFFVVPASVPHPRPGLRRPARRP
jgi:hypothetical protein